MNSAGKKDNNNLKKPKMTPRRPQNGLERAYHKVFGCSRQLLLNKFFDPSSPSMRNKHKVLIDA